MMGCPPVKSTSLTSLFSRSLASPLSLTHVLSRPRLVAVRPMRHMPACTVDTYMHWAKDKAACRLHMRERKGWGDGNGQPAVWFSWRARPNRLVRQTWTVQKQKARPKKREKREEKERPSLPTKKNAVPTTPVNPFAPDLPFSFFPPPHLPNLS